MINILIEIYAEWGEIEREKGKTRCRETEVENVKMKQKNIR